MIINSIYQQNSLLPQQQQQQQESDTNHNQDFKMEDLNNNINCLLNKNSYVPTFQTLVKSEDPDYSIKQSLKTESFDLPVPQQNLTAPKCANCIQPIEDKYIYNLMNMYWHEECLTCSQCCSLLNHSCFFKNGLLYCKEDYFKNFGSRCNSCMDLISPNELVMRIETVNTKQLIYYHLNCFKCLVCDKHLQKGEEYVLRQEGIYCKMDFEKSKYQKNRFVNTSPNYNGQINVQQKLNSNSNSSFNSQPSEEENSVDSIKYRMVLANQPQNEQVPKKSNSRRVTKRPRTILNAAQRYDFREAFKQSQKPCRKVREHLADKTGLSVRVVQVWFQNERAKMKKMQRRQQQMNKYGDMSSGNGKKKASNKKAKKDGMSNDEDESLEEDESDVDSEDFSDDDESLDLNESESQMNNQNLSEQVGFSNLQFSDTDNLMMGAGFPQNENECMNLMNLQYPQQQQQQQQPQQHQLCQMQPNPITRLYSMQNSYF